MNRNLRVSFFCDGRERVLLRVRQLAGGSLLLLAAGDRAGLHQLRDGRGAVGRVQALVRGRQLVPRAAQVRAGLPGLLRLEEGAVGVDARVRASVLQQRVFAAAVARHGGAADLSGFPLRLPPSPGTRGRLAGAVAARRPDSEEKLLTPEETTGPV